MRHPTVTLKVCLCLRCQHHIRTCLTKQKRRSKEFKGKLFLVRTCSVIQKSWKLMNNHELSQTSEHSQWINFSLEMQSRCLMTGAAIRPHTEQIMFALKKLSTSRRTNTCWHYQLNGKAEIMALTHLLRGFTSQHLTYSLHKDDVVTCSLAENNGLVGCSGDTSECSRGRRWPDEGVHVSWELSHTSLIAHQRPCSKRDESLGSSFTVQCCS